MASNGDCIFCKIVAGDLPAEKILEDDQALAFMDIGPVAEGHVLLIPKPHHEVAGEMPADLAAAVLRHVPALARAVQEAVGSAGLNILQNNGRIASQAVPHVHFHFIPRSEEGEFHFNWPAREYPDGRLAELADAIRAAM